MAATSSTTSRRDLLAAAATAPLVPLPLPGTELVITTEHLASLLNDLNRAYGARIIAEAVYDEHPSYESRFVARRRARKEFEVAVEDLLFAAHALDWIETVSSEVH